MSTFAATGFRQTGVVRDQLYDRIALADEELALISTRPFQRLERIQQLGFASRIWPGARHTRFEHSLGVLHLARRALDLLLDRYGAERVPVDSARVVTAAALLHDVGHYPFSHAIEELGPPIEPHERVGRSIVLSEPIAGILREHWDLDPTRVAAIIDPHGHDLPETDRLLRGLLSGPLDVDKMDYLPRDARACGVPYGGVDTERLLDSLRIIDVNGNLRIGIGNKGISPTHSLINARQEMFDNVYWHHTNRACMIMVQRAVQDALRQRSLTAIQVTGVDDSQLLVLLQQPEMPASTRKLAAALHNRSVHKRALEYSSRAVSIYGRLGALWGNPEYRRQVEDHLATYVNERAESKLEPGDVLIDIPKPEKWRTDVLVAFDNPPEGFAAQMNWRDVVGFSDADMKRYEEHRRLIRIVVTPQDRPISREIWRDAATDALDSATSPV